MDAADIHPILLIVHANAVVSLKDADPTRNLKNRRVVVDSIWDSKRHLCRH